MTPKEMFKIYNKVYLENVKVQDNGYKYEMIDYSVAFGESWHIMKITKPDQTIEYDLVVSITSFTRSKDEYHNYHVKEIAANSSPYYWNCPKKFVDKIIELDQNYFESYYGSSWLETWKEEYARKQGKARTRREMKKQLMQYRPNYSKPYIAI